MRDTGRSAACVLFALVLAAQTSSPQELSLDPRIPPADTAAYEQILDAANWRNPRLTIRADGIAVDSRVVSGQPRVVVPYDLPRVLVSLPIEAWPYGRVVALTDLGIREADGQDTPAIARNHTAALAVLDDLDVVAEWWP